MDRQTKVYQISLLFQTSEFWFYVETLCKPYQNLVQRLLVLEKYTSLVFFIVCLPSGSAGFKARAQPHNPDRSANNKKQQQRCCFVLSFIPKCVVTCQTGCTLQLSGWRLHKSCPLSNPFWRESRLTRHTRLSWFKHKITGSSQKP